MSNRYIIFFLFLTLGFQVFGQQDKPRYDARTTLYFNEEVIRDNLDTLYRLDTTLQRLHQFDARYFGQYQMQDLGVPGTASQNLVYTHKARLGRQLGYNSYDFYAYDNDDVKYYNTLSPESEVNFIQTSNRILYFDGGFTRNFGPNINAGFRLKRFTAADPIGTISQNEIFADHYSAQLFTSIQSNNQRYHLLANYRYMRTIVNETGGVSLDSNDVAIDSLFGELEERALNNVETQDRRNDWRVYHQYNLTADSSTEGLYAYHIFDKLNQKNYMNDTDVPENIDYYGFVPTRDSSDVLDTLIYDEWGNEFGLKYQREGMLLRGYYKYRAYNFDRIRDTVTALGWQNEHHFGINGQVNLKGDLFGVKGGYNSYLYQNTSWNALNLGVISKYGEVSYTNKTDPVSIVNFGLPSQWAMDSLTITALTESVNHNVLNIKVQYPGEKFRTSLSYTANTIDNYWALFGSENGPIIGKVTDVNIDVLRFDYSLRLGRFVFLGDFTQTSVSNGASQEFSDEPLNVPDLLVNQEVYYESQIRSKKVVFQLGFDVGYRSSVFADAYSPLYQRFFVQRDVELQDYIMLDLFANFQIKQRFSIGIRIPHVNQGMGGIQGYQTTPFYLGQDRTFEFGINWRFFD